MNYSFEFFIISKSITLEAGKYSCNIMPGQDLKKNVPEKPFSPEAKVDVLEGDNPSVLSVSTR